MGRSGHWSGIGRGWFGVLRVALGELQVCLWSPEKTFPEQICREMAFCFSDTAVSGRSQLTGLIAKYFAEDPLSKQLTFANVMAYVIS